MNSQSERGTTTGAAVPRMLRVRQPFAAAPVLDHAREVQRQLEPLTRSLRPRTRVAVAVGSRGIAHLKQMVATAIDVLKAAQAEPFVVPAMGSHGGGTPEGQVSLLAEYGITAAQLGVPIQATMEVERVGETADGLPVVCSVAALRADAVLLVQRVKPHTDFGGALGSGLLKMLVVGLGKQVGAAHFHQAAARFGHERVLRQSARVLQQRLPLLGGLAILENQRHETARLEAVRPAEFEAREEALCAEARTLMPTLPFDTVDLLIVDRMGKNISGTGMDPAVIGRMVHGYSLSEEAGKPAPRVRRLFVRDLTPESHGNAIGIGMADFTTTRLVRAMDPQATTLNALTSLSLQGAKVPIYFESDREVVHQALASLPLLAIDQAKVVRIQDTLSVEQFEASEACLSAPELAGRLEPLSEPGEMKFGPDGNLLPL